MNKRTKRRNRKRKADFLASCSLDEIKVIKRYLQFSRDERYTLLVNSFNASLWATEFIKTVCQHPEITTDHGSMIGWFACAIMAGYDRCEWEMRQPLSEPPRVVSEPPDASPEAPNICRTCMHLHGVSYPNGSTLICGMHPFGNGENCTDFQEY